LEIITFRIGSKEVTAAERRQMTLIKRRLSVSISENGLLYIGWRNLIKRSGVAPFTHNFVGCDIINIQTITASYFPTEKNFYENGYRH
jgi:hypothetical protein